MVGTFDIIELHFLKIICLINMDFDVEILLKINNNKIYSLYWDFLESNDDRFVIILWKMNYSNLHCQLLFRSKQKSGFEGVLLFFFNF